MSGRHARPSRAQARAGGYAVPRQPVSERVRAARRARLRRRAGGAAGASALLAGALVVGLLGGGGTYALWQTDAPYDAGIVVPHDGEVSLKFAVGSPTSATAAFTNLLPGESQTLPVTLENDGDFDLEIAAELTGVTGSGFALRLAIDANCTASGYLTAPVLPGATMALDTPVAVGAIQEGQTALLCVEVTADAAMAPSAAMTFDVTLAGESAS